MMARIPARDTVAGRVYNDLRLLARSQGRATDELLVWYGLERWLYRLSTSSHAKVFVLKGGMLLAALDARRPTRDVDFLAQHLSNDHDQVVRIISEIAAIAVDDGVVFDADQIRASSIREADHYAGVRVTVPVSISQARTKLSLDINFGDPVTPGVILTDFPQLLGGAFQLAAYPVETVIAEKLTTAIALGEANTRERDWADLWRITGNHALNGADITAAIHRTAEYRAIPLASLTGVAQNLGALRQSAYTAWLRRQLADAAKYPDSYAEITIAVAEFADSLVTGAAEHQQWNPSQRLWEPTEKS